jgi:hypothetical protein
MFSPLKDELSAIEALVRGASPAEARERLLRLVERKRDRADLAEIAWLAWRCDLPKVGIRVLGPLIRPDRKSPAVPTDREKAEYAACLIKIGAVNEGELLLRSVDPKLCPVALLYQVFALATRWEYEASIAPLEAYIASPGVSPYQKIVARVNLAQAFVFERHHEKASAELKALTHDRHIEENALVGAKVRELEAQNFVFQKKTEEALRHVAKAKERHGNAESLDAFFVTKWQAIARLVEKGPGPETLSEMGRLKEQAIARSHWETMRECDRFVACATKDEALFWKVYFGTPYARYRHWLRRDFGETKVEPQSIVWQVSEGENSAAKPLVLEACLEKGKKASWLLDRLLRTLTSDFYRPHRIASLFQQIYPDEHFNPLTSPAKVHDAVARLRERFRVSRFPLEVEESNGFYRLSSAKACFVQIRREASRTRLDELILVCQKAGPDRALSPQQIAKLGALSLRTTQRLLKEAVERGLAIREGQGRATTYRFPEVALTTGAAA